MMQLKSSKSTPGPGSVGNNLNEQDFQALRESLPLEHQKTINELSQEFPSVHPHIIYNVMRKMDFTKGLVRAQLKFSSNLQ